MALKQNLGWLEAGLYLGGIALISVFLFLKFESNQQAQEGIDAFYASGPVEAAAESGSDAINIPIEVTDPWVEVPDQGKWSEQRIKDYQDSLKLAAEPPHAILTIEKLGIQVPVFNGTDEFNLNRGAGRIKGTAQVNETGNLGIAAHRDSFFRPLKEIEVGDEMKLLTHTGEEIYRVTSIVITDPNDVSVLEPTTEKTITLVTCYPFYYVGHAPQRFIVKASVRHLLAIN